MFGSAVLSMVASSICIKIAIASSNGSQREGCGEIGSVISIFNFLNHNLEISGLRFDRFGKRPL